MFGKRQSIALTVGAAVVAMLLATAPASAARYGGGRGGGWGGYSGYGGARYGGWGGGWGWGGGYYGGYYPSYYSSWGWNSPYYGGYYSGYTPYYNTGYYSGYYAPSTVQYSTPSLYYSPSNTGVTSSDMDANAARVEVRVPDANAQVFFNGDATQQRGAERTFVTPALNGSGTYNIEARWMENGKQVDRTQKVTVTPGQTTQVNFNE